MFLLLKAGDENKREKILAGPFSTKEEMNSFAPENQQFAVLQVDEGKISFHTAQRPEVGQTKVLIELHGIAVIVVVVSLLLTFLVYFLDLLNDDNSKWWIATLWLLLHLLIGFVVFKFLQRRKFEISKFFKVTCVLLSPIIVPLYVIAGWLKQGEHNKPEPVVVSPQPALEGKGDKNDKA